MAPRRDHRPHSGRTVASVLLAAGGLAALTVSHRVRSSGLAFSGAAQGGAFATSRTAAHAGHAARLRLTLQRRAGEWEDEQPTVVEDRQSRMIDWDAVDEAEEPEENVRRPRKKEREGEMRSTTSPGFGKGKGKGAGGFQEELTEEDELDELERGSSTIGMDVSEILSRIGGVGVTDGDRGLIKQSGAFQEDLKACRSISQIVELGVAAIDDGALDPEDIKMLFRRLARLLSRQGASEDVMQIIQDWKFARLIEGCTQSLANEWLDSSSAADLLRSIASIHVSLPDMTDVMGLIPPIALAFPDAARKMDARNVTSSLNSVAKLVQADGIQDIAPCLLESTANMAKQLTPAEIPNIIRAIGDLTEGMIETRGVAEAVIHEVTHDLVMSYDMRRLSSLAWGLSRLRDGTWDRSVVTWIAESAKSKMEAIDKATAKSAIPRLMCALRLLQLDDEELTTRVSARLLARGFITKMPRWELAALTWSWPEEEGLPDVKYDLDGQRRGDAKKVHSILVTQALKRRLSQNAISRAPNGPNDWPFHDAPEKQRDYKREAAAAGKQQPSRQAAPQAVNQRT